MVHTGWALAMPRKGTKYARIERRAERARRGLWQGRFTPPWAWKPYPPIAAAAASAASSPLKNAPWAVE